MFYLTLILLFILLIFGTMAWAALSAAPYVPLFKRDIRRMLKLAKAGPSDIIYDFGSGDGRILITASKEFKVKKCVGFEISFLPYIFSRIKILVLGLNKCIDIIPKNFYNQNINKATIITCFLTPKAMKKLGPKFQRELKPGARVVSYAFSIPSLNPVKVDKPTPKSTSIYLYKF